MKIIDTHCDALWKIQLSNRSLDYQSSDELHTNIERLKKGNVYVQFYAIFIEPEVLVEDKWRDALDQIEIFEREVIAKNSEMVHITKWEQLNELKQGQIGAVLTLEGADAFGNDLEKLNELYRRGVLSIGLTWNNANLCADGVEEPRGAGLTALGKQVVQSNNERGVLTDVAHASEKTFWDVIDVAKYPFASHSNARAICDHPRNLYDDQ